ncbi:phenylacetic acid degradation protein [Paucibacter aquatile]|uniref:Phenylacetic acid degradation protein n=1 Tax=Kinneretia aquatilis TaxID=2070761 RepID=A0A2N8KS62_9BURK|nr:MULTISPECIES: PaaI family thioesterase [Roseateles]PND36308.1 phenylacetic acid degradation protein [Paucibacter aquatile]
MSTHTPPPASGLQASDLQAALPRIFAPWIVDMGLEVLSCSPGEVSLRLPVKPAFVHVGGVMCGQVAMAAADTAMVLAMMTELGEFKPMTTVQLQTSFLRPVSGPFCLIRATVLRRGKSLAFGSIDILNPDERLAAQATTTYALL